MGFLRQPILQFIIMKPILANYSASILELKNNPSALLDAADGASIAILNHNEPVAYLVPAETYEWLMDMLEDCEFSQLVEKRRMELKNAIAVNIDDL